MKPSTFFKKLSQKISELEPERKKQIFTKTNLKILKRISEYCQKEKKTIVLVDRKERAEFSKVTREFDLSMYYTRRGWAIFLTNFDKKIYTRFRDDRYRFLKKIYPNCGEYKRLVKERNDFFEHVLK
jgi:Ni,Fe-hydrogenase III component G